MTRMSAQLVALRPRGNIEGEALSCQNADSCLVDGSLNLVAHAVGVVVDHLYAIWGPCRCVQEPAKVPRLSAGWH